MPFAPEVIVETTHNFLSIAGGTPCCERRFLPCPRAPSSAPPRLCHTPRWRSYRLRLGLLPLALGQAARPAWGRAARLVEPDLLPAACLVAAVHRLCRARPGRPAELGLPARSVMVLREVIIASVLHDMAPHAAIRVMVMTGDTDVGQDMAQLMPPDTATATPGMAMTATVVTELTAPGVTATLRYVTSETSAQGKRVQRRTPGL
jgi:hypothetical protein